MPWWLFPTYSIVITSQGWTFQCGVADFFLGPPTLTASSFAALWPTYPKFLALKDLNLLEKYTKNQEASSILEVLFFSQSDLIYIGNLVTVPFHLILTVY